MSDYAVVNILDLMDAIGEDELQHILSDFSCPQNMEIENFVRENAVEFAKRKMSVTYLVIDGESRVTAMFALTHKAVQIMSEGLSSSLRKKIQRYAQLDEETGMFMLSSFLIGQFGKNYQYQNILKPDGKELMEAVFRILKHVQREIGGGVVYLECENKPQLLQFYQNDINRFRIFGERFSKPEGVTYIQLLKIF